LEIFRWTPYSPPSLKEGFRVLASQYENGKERRYFKGKAPRQWTLQFRQKLAGMLEIRDFYRARKGAYEAFLWTEPYTGELLVVRFSGESLDIESQWKANLTTGAPEICFGTFNLIFKELL
jgi:phage-related protein